jgi:hypothetical protein
MFIPRIKANAKSATEIEVVGRITLNKTVQQTQENLLFTAPKVSEYLINAYTKHTVDPETCDLTEYTEEDKESVAKCLSQLYRYIEQLGGQANEWQQTTVSPSRAESPPPLFYERRANTRSGSSFLVPVPNFSPIGRTTNPFDIYYTEPSDSGSICGNINVTVNGIKTNYIINSADDLHKVAMKLQSEMLCSKQSKALDPRLLV